MPYQKKHNATSTKPDVNWLLTELDKAGDGNVDGIIHRLPAMKKLAELQMDIAAENTAQRTKLFSLCSYYFGEEKNVKKMGNQKTNESCHKIATIVFLH